MPVEILEPGLASSIQDRGRPGYYNVGIPPSGAADLRAAAAANLLVGNPLDAAVIESPYMGPVLRFDEPTVVAVTGADMPVMLNGEPAPQWESFAVAAGDQLTFGFLRAGARIYIAVAGGFDVPVVLGSRSTYALGGFGGFQGRNLKKGDVVPVGRPSGGVPGQVVPETLRPVYSRDVELRVVLGLYDYRLTDAGRSCLLESEWTLTPVADRTGFRYSGPVLEWEERVQPFGAGSDPSNIVDAGYPVGSIQVPGGVEPIILHRDAVSGGGYAMVASVISADLNLVAQCSPGTRTRFVAVTLDEALRARADSADRELKLRQALGAAT
ncbi:biotin-dependent carboxyltransferase family protein [Nonomuraea cavernae]|uniref:Allophanate hydrolase n=1 Tax=Nonomuraea cavernae TaxID=2045107 RepID=A0A918DJC5_9ACTN|nr:biotin-dependent carboxyltransferase family protein [Nonomuraea cavernae]MCA2186125.1 biotin-dependent carboxyltransferase family protein [Nonomuraea cavernae]GGO70138.1 allophanate hydrolase [Nonomuraea cavernae]